MIREKQQSSEIVIDLTGPQGNAFFLLGTATKFAKQLGYTEKEVHDLIQDMKFSDYDNLIEVFDTHFGHFVTLER
jgi:hypothetical protein